MTPLTQSNTARTIIIVLAAFLAYGVVAGLRATSGVLATDFATLTGISYGESSYITSIRNLLFAIFCPVWGFLTLRKSHIFVLIIGLLLTALGFIGIVIFPTYAGLIIFQGICFGVGSAAISYSIVYGAAAPFLSPKAAALFSGILLMAQGIFNMILAPILTASTELPGGFAIALTIISIVIAALIPTTLFFRWKNHNTVITDNVSSVGYTSMRVMIKTLAKSPLFYLLCISFLTYGLCDSQMINHLYQRATESMSLSAETGTFLVMLYGLTLILGPLIGGVLAAKIRNRRLTLAILFLSWAVIATLFILPSHTNETLAILFTLILGTSISIVVPLHVVLLQEEVPLKFFAPVFCLIGFLEFFGAAITAFVGGIIFDLTGGFISLDIVIISLALFVGIVYAITGFRMRQKLS